MVTIEVMMKTKTMTRRDAVVGVVVVVAAAVAVVGCVDSAWLWLLRLLWWKVRVVNGVSGADG
jgi:hypothetical protein